MIDECVSKLLHISIIKESNLLILLSFLPIKQDYNTDICSVINQDKPILYHQSNQS